MTTSHVSVDPQYLSLFPYYGRYGQDRFLDESIFHHKAHGVFVDLGAYDGIQSSNTLFFEESLAWDGVCVEPLPHVFAQLRLNRTCRCINACAADAHGTAAFTHVIPRRTSRSPEGRVLNFEKLSGLTDFYAPEHRDAIARVLRDTGGRLQPLRVQCVPVNEILELTRSRTIDCLSLDTEGSEFHIIKAIDFERFDITVIVVEVLHVSEDFDRFMADQGYRLITTLGHDRIYRQGRRGS